MENTQQEDFTQAVWDGPLSESAMVEMCKMFPDLEFEMQLQ
jgi:hypothetical protein